MLYRIAACAAMILFMPVSVTAATYIVDSTADDGSPGTLRWAIEEHNDNLGTPNDIVFDAALAGQVVQLTTSGPGTYLPLLFGELVIDGSAAPGVTVDGGGDGRIFIIGSNADITLKNFRVINSTNSLFGGACIRAGSNDTLTLDGMVFEQCESRSTSSGDVYGGAVHAVADGPDSLVHIVDTVFRDNRAYGNDNLVFGGALYVAGGELIIESSRFELNTAEDTGSAFHQGGAVFVEDADATITATTFFANQAAGGTGGAMALDALAMNTALFRGNLFSANVADIGAAIWTGGVASGDQPDFDFAQNTFAANTSNSANTGGAIYFRQGDVRLRSNSLVDNVDLAGGGAHIAYQPGGVTFPSVWNNAFGPAGSDACRTFNNDPPAAFPSAGYNLLPDTSCAFNGTGDIVDAAAGFLPLGDYGGPVLTVPPDPDNPAVEGGNPALPNDADWTTCPETDARGELRPVDSDLDGDFHCDVGVFEWQHEPAIFQDGFEAGQVIP